MKRKARVYDANGNFLRELQDGEILKDGESIRLELTMLDGMDSMQRLVVQDSMTPQTPLHAPGYVTDSNYDARAERFFDQKKRLADAWKAAPSAAPALDPAKSAMAQPQAVRDANDAYARRNAALEKAYLTAGA